MARPNESVDKRGEGVNETVALELVQRTKQRCRDGRAGVRPATYCRIDRGGRPARSCGKEWSTSWPERTSSDAKIKSSVLRCVIILSTMRSEFSVVSRLELGSATWDALCAESHDAWLFHTSGWLPILKIEDVSFAIMDHAGKPLSLVGIGLPTNGSGRKVWLSTFRAGVAHMGGLPCELRHELERFALSEVQRIAKSKRALRIDWELPSMPPGPEALVSALAKFGYQCQIWPSKVVDLTRSEDALWKDYRKGCKSVIRRAQRLGVTVDRVADESGVAVFADMHSRRMRSISASPSDPDVFMAMWKLLAPLGQCEILLASLSSGVPVAGILLLSYKNMTYYHAACSDPNHMESGGNTLLVHEAVLRAKSRGATLFHMGPSPMASQVSEKAYLVGRFKNQFGGQQSAWVMASLVLRTPLAVRGVSALLPLGLRRRLRGLRAN